MPTFEFTAPDGKTYEVAGPEGATQEQAFGMLQQQIAGGAPARPQSQTTTQAPQLPAQYHAFQSLMKSPSEIAALPQGQGRAIMALPFALIPGGPAMQAATGGIAGAIANPDAPGTGAALGAATGLSGGLLAKGTGALVEAGKNFLSSKTLPAGDAAKALLSKALERDQIPPDVVNQTTSRYPDKDIAVMDAGGSNTARLARTVRTLGGEGGEKVDNFLAERQADQHARVLSDIRSNLADGSDVYQQVDDLLAKRSADARPLFKQAEAAAKPVWSPRLQQFLDDPVLKQGLARGVKIQRLESLAEGTPFNPSDYSVSFDTNGEPLISWAGKGEKDLPNLKTLQAAKEGLDAMVEGYRNPVTGKLVLDKDGVALQKVQRAFTQELKAQAPPEYSQALEAWAGPSQSRDAIERGKDFLKSPPELLSKAMDRLSEADQDFYRIGAARALQDRVLKAGDNFDAVSRVFGNKNLRSQIETVFGKGSADKFAEAMSAEKMATATNRTIRGGSQTADKAVDLSQGDQVLNDVVQGGIHGGIRGAIMNPAVNALSARANAFFNGMTPEVRNALAGLLVQTGERPLNGLASANVPATAIDNRASSILPFIGSQALKNLLLVPSGPNRP